MVTYERSILYSRSTHHEVYQRELTAPRESDSQLLFTHVFNLDGPARSKVPDI
jgi:hypothetical protein